MTEIIPGAIQVPAGELAAFALAMEQAQKALAALGAARAEWLCEPCKAIHPWRSGDFILVPCPACETPMMPTSPALRDLQEARAELAELRAENERLYGSVELKHTAPYLRAAERERIRTAAESLKITLFRPGNGPAHTQALDVVPLADLLGMLGKDGGAAMTDLPPDEEPLTPAEVAEILGVHSQTVVRMANSGRLPSFRTLGGHRRFHRAGTEKFAATYRPPGEWATLTQVATALRVDAGTAAQWARTGKLAGAFKDGAGQWLIPRATVTEMTR